MAVLPRLPLLMSFGRRACLGAVGAFLVLMMAQNPAEAASRLKDIVDFEGVRNNMLVGYGLVVGLNGTGDSLGNAPFTNKSLISMLERLGVHTRGDKMNSKNVAAVMVTATLRPFATQRSQIDVNVATLGDAKDLQGGTLLVTPLMGADGEVYAVAQGPIASGAFAAEGEGATVTKGVPTSGRIPNGGIIEREINFSLADLPSLRLSLRNPDFTTARRIADTISRNVKGISAEATDPATVKLVIPEEKRRDIVRVMTQVEQLTVEPDQIARVIVDEKSGVIVMGENVRINTVAIAQGSLTVSISETPNVSQPTPLSGGDTAVTPNTSVNVEQGEGKKIAILQSGARLQDVVQSLNALGVSPRDMITILQSIKAAGALQADLELI